MAAVYQHWELIDGAFKPCTSPASEVCINDLRTLSSADANQNHVEAVEILTESCLTPELTNLISDSATSTVEESGAELHVDRSVLLHFNDRDILSWKQPPQSDKSRQRISCEKNLQDEDGGKNTEVGECVLESKVKIALFSEDSLNGDNGGILPISGDKETDGESLTESKKVKDIMHINNKQNREVMCHSIEEETTPFSKKSIYECIEKLPLTQKSNNVSKERDLNFVECIEDEQNTLNLKCGRTSSLWTKTMCLY